MCYHDINQLNISFTFHKFLAVKKILKRCVTMTINQLNISCIYIYSCVLWVLA